MNAAKWALFGFVLLNGTTFLYAEDVPALWCIDKMELPVYEGIFWQAQITGNALVSILVAKDGKASDVKVKSSPHPAMTLWLERSFRKAIFLNTCVGKTLEIALQYKLEGRLTENPENRITIRYPGEFVIMAGPPLLHGSID